MANDDLKNELKMDLNWSLFGTGPAMIKAFRDGKLDIGYMGLPPAIIGMDKGVPIKCIAGGHVEGTILIGKKNHKNINQFNGNLYDVFAQFKGYAIGVPSKGSIHDIILNHFLKKYNLLNYIKVINYEQAEFIAIDLKKGVLEGGVGTPALVVFASTLLDTHLVIFPEYLMANNPSYGIFFHENIVKNEPKLILKFLEHHKKASFLLRNLPLRAAEIISKTFVMVKKEYVSSILQISPKYCIALSEDYINSTMEFMKILNETGYIKSELKIKDIFDFTFVNKVHPEKEHYSEF